MVSILLTILKILGIILLILLGIVLVVLLLVLFVPVRYRLDAHRNLQEEAPVIASVKVTWLLRLIRVLFSYPDAAYVCVKVLGITLYRSDREKKPKEQQTDATDDAVTASEDSTAEDGTTEAADDTWEELTFTQENVSGDEKEQNDAEDIPENELPEDENPTLKRFIVKLWDKIKNIKYTITQICDKIKHIVKNIRYYVKVLQSNTFKNAFSLCSGELFKLLKSIRPRKVKGKLLIGTGDPASTGQVLSIYGMLYPFIGNNIDITPDFEQQIIEGELLVKGRITVFKALKMALVIFFNKDVKRLMKVLKREAV